MKEKHDEVVADERKENFQMSKQLFLVLYEELRQYISKNTTRFRKPISVEMQVTVSVYYLPDERQIRKTANVFGIAKDTVSVTIRRAAKAISNYLADKYMKLSQTERGKS